MKRENRRKKKKGIRKTILFFAIVLVSFGVFSIKSHMLSEENKNLVILASNKNNEIEKNEKLEETKIFDMKISKEKNKSLQAKNDEISQKVEKVTETNNKNGQDLTKIQDKNCKNVNSLIDPYATDASTVFVRDGKKIAYLTFDDGPTRNITPSVLEILNKYNVKATFFITGNMAQQNPDLVKREYNEGHSIGNHTYSHDYKTIYASTQNFMQDIKKSEAVFKKALGNDFSTRLVRFPGGSFEKYKDPIKQQLSSEGYVYIDWNALDGDAEGHHIPKDKLIGRVKETVQGKEKVVILMHDAATKDTTVDALPGIIEYLRAEGYEFKVLK